MSEPPDSRTRIPEEKMRHVSPSLLARARDGDPDAQDQIVRRYTTLLRRWGHGRLPRVAREQADTEDLVQITLMKALGALGTFEPRWDGAFTMFLHKVFTNAMLDEINKALGHPFRSELPEHLPGVEKSQTRALYEREVFEAYREALQKLPADQQRAVVLRMELGYSHQELAEALGSASADAARMFFSRAFKRLLEEVRQRVEGRRRNSSGRA